ncbi:hypothetical protein DB32_008256 [Sandaracinus amylolyticus]|uniref:Uncharacterized protein n=1 Tax=Sandaracinus amylolyticus TaxID=927083 RepID=A0A0F6YMU6_9BACT|nr:hypothetical protein DB32_008256 [Sandaracinus amylolyticus]
MVQFLDTMVTSSCAEATQWPFPREARRVAREDEAVGHDLA